MVISKPLIVAYYYVPNKRVTDWPYRVLQWPVRYYRTQILWFIMCTLQCYPPPNLQKKCYWFSQSFYVRQGLRCRHRGLVIERHNKVCDDVLQLARQYIPSNCVHSELRTIQGSSISEEEVLHRRFRLDIGDNTVIKELWESQTDAIIYFIFGDSDSDTYKIVK